MVPTILKPNHWKSEQNGGHFVPISNGFRQNGHHFVQNRTPLENWTPLENRTEGYHWIFERIWYSSPHCLGWKIILELFVPQPKHSRELDPVVKYSIFTHENQSWIFCNETDKTGSRAKAGTHTEIDTGDYLIKLFEPVNFLS